MHTCDSGARGNRTRWLANRAVKGGRSMKKALRVLLALCVGLVACTGTAFAAPVPQQKAASVALYVNGVEDVTEITVDQGDVVDLAALTLKQGSSMTDQWTGVTESDVTVLNTATGYYEAAAKLDTTGLAAGDYEVEYSIIMAAGKSHVTFEGSKKTSMTVVESAVTVKKITIRVLTNEARYSSGSKPQITGYECTADGVAELSDGTEILIDEFRVNFNKFQDATEIEVTVMVNGMELTFDLDLPFTEAGEEVVFVDPVVSE